jgi:hypothetical protein
VGTVRTKKKDGYCRVTPSSIALLHDSCTDRIEYLCGRKKERNQRSFAFSLESLEVNVFFFIQYSFFISF